MITPLSQRDPRWKDKRLGTGATTIGAEGCLITTLAMLGGTTPDVINDRLIKVGGFKHGNLVIWSKLNEIGFKFIKRSFVYDNDDVSANLPCIVEVNGSRIGATQHFVLYVGNKKMIDPWFGKELDTSYYPAVGYAIVKVGIIPPEENSSSMDDIRLRILEENNIKTEGDVREVIGAWRDLPKVKTNLENLKAEYEELAKKHTRIKDELTSEVQMARDEGKRYKEERDDILRQLAGRLGTTQEEAKILPEVDRLIKLEKEFQDIIDNRPLTKHPFDGVGELIKELLRLLIKLVKKWLGKK